MSCSVDGYAWQHKDGCDMLQIIHDLNSLTEKICGDFLGHVVELLSSSSTEVLDLVMQSILEGGASLKDLIPKVMNSIIQTVVEKSVETFLDGERATAYLTRDVRDELVQGAALEITVRYYELAADLVSVVSTETQFPGFLLFWEVNLFAWIFSSSIVLALKAFNMATRLGKRSLHFREYVRVHKREREQVQMSWTIMCRILIRSVCNYFLIFRNMGVTSLHLEFKQ